MNIELTPQEERLLEKLKDEELNRRKRFGLPVIFLTIGCLLLWMYWNAPFAFDKFQTYLRQLPYHEREKLPWADSYGIIAWIAGVFMIVRAVFWMFDRKRRLIVKLLMKLSEKPEQPPIP